LLCVAELEFENHNHVLSRDDIKRMSAELLMTNQHRAASEMSGSQKSRSSKIRRHHKKTQDWLLCYHAPFHTTLLLLHS